MLAWSDELNAQAEKLCDGTAATTSTLVKRGPKHRADTADEDSKPPTKRPKTEGGNLEDEVKQSFQKGTISKVLTSPMPV